MPMRPLAIAAALCLAVTPCLAADIEAGRLSAEPCRACHGEAGVSADPMIPSLAGQRERYLQWQLVFFRSGRRVNEVMSPLAAALSDEEIRNLAAYFTSLPPGRAPAGPPDRALHEVGRQTAMRHRCAACHTDSFGGNQAAPAIAHQPRGYTAKVLRDYRSAARPSVGVAAMTEAATALSDEDIAALAQFLEAPE